MLQRRLFHRRRCSRLGLWFHRFAAFLWLIDHTRPKARLQSPSEVHDASALLF
jgi:hypothetical protein